MLVDHLVSDSAAAAARLDNSINKAEARDRLLALFTRWQAVADPVRQGAPSSPLVGDAVAAAEGLARTATIGLEALGFIATGTSAPPDWSAGRLEELTRLEQPQNLLRVMIVQPVRRLVTSLGSGRGS
jgi:hypothetical protein